MLTTLFESIAAEVASVLSRPEVLEKLHTGLIDARALLVLLRRRAECVRSMVTLASVVMQATSTSSGAQSPAGRAIS